MQLLFEPASELLMATFFGRRAFALIVPLSPALVYLEAELTGKTWRVRIEQHPLLQEAVRLPQADCRGFR